MERNENLREFKEELGRLGKDYAMGYPVKKAHIKLVFSMNYYIISMLLYNTATDSQVE